MAKMIKSGSVEEYIKRFPEPQQSRLRQIREAIKTAAPKAEESISYGMPGYKLNGVLVYFGGFANHCSFFPAGYSAILQFKDELKDFKTSKGTIQLPMDKPLPLAVIKKIVKARIKENKIILKTKANKKSNNKIVKT